MNKLIIPIILLIVSFFLYNHIEEPIIEECVIYKDTEWYSYGGHGVFIINCSGILQSIKVENRWRFFENQTVIKETWNNKPTTLRQKMIK